MCTSFATYFGEPIYAQNIDHPDRERKFKITKLKCNKGCADRGQCDNCKLKDNTIIRFHCQNRENGRFLDGVCMNSLGMFSNYQVLTPNNDKQIPKPKTNALSAGNLFSQSQMYMGNVSELLNRIDERTVVHNDSFGFAMHNMFADKEGWAVILEASYKGNAINHLHNKYIVMTNFPVYEFEGKHYSDVRGDGSDRYIIAHEEIQKNKDSFGIEQAFGVLEKARHTSEHFPTVCSMVFDPVKLQVYISLFGMFDKIWKVSMLDKTIETYEGFNESKQLKIGSKGILASQLEEYM